MCCCSGCFTWAFIIIAVLFVSNMYPMHSAVVNAILFILFVLGFLSWLFSLIFRRK